MAASGPVKTLTSIALVAIALGLWTTAAWAIEDAALSASDAPTEVANAALDVQVDAVGTADAAVGQVEEATDAVVQQAPETVDNTVQTTVEQGSGVVEQATDTVVQEGSQVVDEGSQLVSETVDSNVAVESSVATGSTSGASQNPATNDGGIDQQPATTSTETGSEPPAETTSGSTSPPSSSGTSQPNDPVGNSSPGGTSLHDSVLMPGSSTGAKQQAADMGGASYANASTSAATSTQDTDDQGDLPDLVGIGEEVTGEATISTRASRQDIEQPAESEPAPRLDPSKLAVTGITIGALVLAGAFLLIAGDTLATFGRRRIASADLGRCLASTP